MIISDHVPGFTQNLQLSGLLWSEPASIWELTGKMVSQICGIFVTLHKWVASLWCINNSYQRRLVAPISDLRISLRQQVKVHWTVSDLKHSWKRLIWGTASIFFIRHFLSFHSSFQSLMDKECGKVWVQGELSNLQHWVGSKSDRISSSTLNLVFLKLFWSVDCFGSIQIYCWQAVRKIPLAALLMHLKPDLQLPSYSRDCPSLTAQYFLWCDWMSTGEYAEEPRSFPLTHANFEHCSLEKQS